MFSFCIQPSPGTLPRHQNEVLFLRCDYLLGGERETCCHGGKSMKGSELKYIFHDYAKMKMHGLIKKAFTEGSAYGTFLYYRVYVQEIFDIAP